MCPPSPRGSWFLRYAALRQLRRACDCDRDRDQNRHRRETSRGTATAGADGAILHARMWAIRTDVLPLSREWTSVQAHTKFIGGRLRSQAMSGRQHGLQMLIAAGSSERN